MKKQKSSKLNLKVKILSGSWKGRNISFLDKSDLRPTKNIIKETLFNWIQEDVQGSICIDMFAGSGSLGFEAASRGAKKVYMIDNNSEITNHLSLQKNHIGAKNISVVTANFKWNDVGSWRALYDVLNPNDEGNIIRGNGKVIDGENNLIQSDKNFTAIIGLDNVVVVNTKDATLVVKKDDVEKVKDLVSFLEKKKKDLI